MNLILETTTGRPVPVGVDLQLPRGPTPVTVQLLTNAVAELLPEGQPVALKLYTPDDTDTPKATFAVWARNTSFQLYSASIDGLATGLAWIKSQPLLARLSYGTPNVDTPLFHVRWGGEGQVGGAPLPQIVITQPAGPVKQTVSLGPKIGNVGLEVYGGHVLQADSRVTGLQLKTSKAPGGADMLVELHLNGVATGAVATLSDGSKFERTAFVAPVNADAGDTIAYEVIQKGIGSTPGAYLSVEAELELI